MNKNRDDSHSIHKSAGTTTRIHSCYPKLLPAERKIADFILSNMDKIESYTIEDIANYAQISKATVTRFCKRLGYEGLKDFRVSAIKEALQNPRVPDAEPKRMDTAAIISHACQINAQMCRDTQLFLIPETIDRVCDMILKKQRIYLLGDGALAPIAQDFFQKLLRLGLIPIYSPDMRIAKMQLALCNQEDIVFGFDFSGSTRSVTDMIKEARLLGALTVGVCNTPGSPLAEESEINLLGPGRIGSDITGTMGPRISLLCIVDSLFSVLQQKIGPENIDSIEKTRRIIVEGWV